MSVEFDPRLCFVLMPMTNEFKGIYEHVIKPTVSELQMDCIYAGEIFGATPVMKDVWEYCAKARVVIADLTDGNTNVYYEAGYSHAFDGEKVVFITQSMEHVTFDVQHFRCIVYDPLPGTIDAFKTELTQNLKAVLTKEPGGLTEVTRTVEKTLDVGAPLDSETREALLLHRILSRSTKRGQRIVADERVAHLLKTLETATIVWPSVAPIKPGKHAVVNVAVDAVLDVHSQPGHSNAVVGAIPPYGTDVEVTGEGQEQDDEVWVPIRHENITGWANSKFLARQVGWVSDEIASRALQIVMALRDEDMNTLATLIHPDKGVRFSPYAYVEDWHEVLTRDQTASALASEETHHWGTDQGSGAPIHLTFREYYDRYVYDVDFARPDVVYFDQHFQSGHYINNIPEAYPEAVTVEYQFEGIDPKLHGFDWRGLRLVLEEKAGTWYVVGVTHDEMGV